MDEQRINLNTAPAEELTRLPGIGPVLAQRIVTYRDTVQAYDEPEDITAVSGIGERGYRAIADRVTVAPPAEISPPAPGVSADRVEEEGLPEEVAEEVSEPVSEDEGELAEETEPEVEALPPAELLSEEGLALAEEAVEESVEGIPPTEEDVSVEATEKAAVEAEQEAVEEATSEAEAGEELIEEEGVLEAEEERVEEELAEEDLPPTSYAPPAETTRPTSWWRRLSWLWIAILGGFLGLAFAMIVWAGVNGSLDVAHSRAVLGIESDVNGLTADVEALGTDVEGLQRRLDALEGLTARMEEVESAVGNLRQQTAELSERTDALEEDLGTLSEAVQAISEDVASLQDQAERTQSFFDGLQALLDDVFGEVEGMSTPAPTPTPGGN